MTVGTVGLPPLPPHRPPPGPEGTRSSAAPAAGGRAAAVRRRLAALRPEIRWWEVPATTLLLVATVLLYVWDLAREGWANTYYAAAVQAGAESWSAFFFGGLDASGFITVDKPPLSLWPIALSVRAFGLNSWSMLLPQAIAGALAVLIVSRMVRRHFGPVAGLLAGAALALTPVAALMFRYNNPDALLTLLLVIGAYTLMRAVEGGRTGWLVAAGAVVGCAFMTKSLQAFLVLPAFAGVWLVAAPGGVASRLWKIAAGVGALVLSAGWWVLAVELTPASARPYIGGSAGNSALDLLWGYNGLDRINGGEGGGGAGMGFSGEAGIGRLFNAQMGGQISWLLPIAALALVVGLWVTRRAPRTDMRRAMYLLWGAWALTHALVFSVMSGIVHPYYTVAMAPAVAALVGMGTVEMWRMRSVAATRWLPSLAIAVTGVWAHVLLGRTPAFVPWLRWAILLAALAAAAVLLIAPERVPRRVALAAATIGVVATLAAPAAFALDTAGSAHAGGNPTAGPATASGVGGPGGGRAGGGFPGGGSGDGRGGMPGGGTPGAGPGGAPPSGATPSGAAPPGGMPGGGSRGAMPGGGGGGAGGSGGAASTELARFLRENAGTARWAAATTGAGTSGPLQLASGLPVMALGGFNGADDAISLDAFIELVRTGQVRYFVGGGGNGLGGGGFGGARRGSTDEIAEWARVNGVAVDTSLTGGTTVYDLADAAS